MFNTAKGRQKYLNMSRNPVVAVSVADKADDFRTLWIKGHRRVRHRGRRRAHRPDGEEVPRPGHLPWRRPGEERVIVRVTPTEKLGRG
ncbi:hypothetical protein V2I01_16645 [Micromonospora sp. BRA006-A]|nr:hypothetical protein [Micromonospora sp. BRA006-A]